MATLDYADFGPAGSGAEYLTLAACQAGESRNFVTADQWGEWEGIGDWSSAPDDTALVNGATTDATRYIEIRTDAANRHAGAWDGSLYRIQSTTNGNLRIADPFVRVVGLQIEPISSAGYGFGAIGGGSDGTIVDCIVSGAGSSIACYGAISTGGFTMQNCVSFGGPCGVSGDGSGTINVYHCTIYGHTIGIDRNSGTLVVRNSLLQNNGTDMTGTFDGATNYNCTEDGTSPGANSFTDTASFVDAANGDFHLTAALSQQGEDLTSLGVTTDFEGDTRTNWDVGADEIAGGDSPGDGAIASSAALAAVGASEAESAGAIAIAATAAATSAAETEAVGSVTSIGALASVGTSEFRAVAAAACVALLVGTSATEARAAGSFASASSVSAVGAAEASGVGSVASVAVFDGVGDQTADGSGDGALAASLTLAATGAAEFRSDGSQAAVGALSATGAAQASGVGSQQSTSAFAAVGDGQFATAGSFASIAAFQATAESEHSGVGAIASVAALTGDGAQEQAGSAAGALASTFSCAATGESTAACVGAITAGSTLAGASATAEDAEADGAMTSVAVFAAVGATAHPIDRPRATISASDPYAPAVSVSATDPWAPSCSIGDD